MEIISGALAQDERRRRLKESTWRRRITVTEDKASTRIAPSVKKGGGPSPLRPSLPLEPAQKRSAFARPRFALAGCAEATGLT